MPNAKKYSGVVVPMLTPFTEKREIDLAAAHRLTEHLIRGGASPFVLGTTGKAASVSKRGRLALVEAVTELDHRSEYYYGRSTRDSTAQY